jgi:hypothetical protein
LRSQLESGRDSGHHTIEAVYVDRLARCETGVLVDPARGAGAEVAYEQDSRGALFAGPGPLMLTCARAVEIETYASRHLASPACRTDFGLDHYLAPDDSYAQTVP